MAKKPKDAKFLPNSQSPTDNPNTLQPRHSQESMPIGLMSEALNTTVSDSIIAGPHGALQQGITPTSDRWSFMSTHTLMLRRTDTEETESPIDFETAIAETGHGCFQYKLMAISGYVYACCSLSTTTLSFVLPAAEYDFNLDSFDKGLLNTAPLFGMVAGAYIWGNFADNKGRKFVLLWALIIDCIASFLSSLCQHFGVFYAFRIFNGFAIIGATSIIFAYTGEFLDHSHRDKYLTRLELFWTLGIIALPIIGLTSLPFDISFGGGNFIFNSWRIFVFSCGIPSLIGAILISRLPESPRFLLLQGKLEKTRAVLVRMYKSNTRKPEDTFSVKVLSESPDAGSYYFQRDKNASCWKSFKNLFVGMYKQHRDLFRGKSLRNIILCCYVDFGLISVYYTMMLWVPELLNREEQFLHKHPNKKDTFLCDMTGCNDGNVQKDGVIEMYTFYHTFITCLACLPTTLMLLCLINWVSKKFLLVGIMVSSAIPAVFLAYASSTFQMVTALCLLKSLTNLAEAVLFVAIVEIFPISTRGTALSLTVTVGRIGSVVGNVVFGAMIDKYCRALFFMMGGNLILSGLACMFFPKMRVGH